MTAKHYAWTVLEVRRPGDVPLDLIPSRATGWDALG